MFPIALTLTVHSAAQLAALHAFAQTMSAPANAVPPAAPAEDLAAKKQSTPALTAAPAPTPSTAEAAGANASESKAESSAPAPASSGRTYTVDDAKNLTIALVKAKGRDEAVKLLSKYGVPVAAKLTPENIAPFCAEAEAAIAS